MRGKHWGKRWKTSQCGSFLHKNQGSPKHIVCQSHRNKEVHEYGTCFVCKNPERKIDISQSNEQSGHHRDVYCASTQECAFSVGGRGQEASRRWGQQVWACAPYCTCHEVLRFYIKKSHRSSKVCLSRLREWIYITGKPRLCHDTWHAKHTGYGRGEFKN